MSLWNSLLRRGNNFTSNRSTLIKSLRYIGTYHKIMSAKSFRVLSIQSHVVHGYVGNKSATFPLQVSGYFRNYIEKKKKYLTITIHLHGTKWHWLDDQSIKINFLITFCVDLIKDVFFVMNFVIDLRGRRLYGILKWDDILMQPSIEIDVFIVNWMLSRCDFINVILKFHFKDCSFT